jgi:hypothetical protein
MKRIVVALGLAALVAAPAAAQLSGMPVWNSVKGGTGITVNADFGKPSSDAGGGSAFGARGSIGLANLTVGAGISSYKPDGGTSSMSFGGNVAMKIMGGGLLPIGINFQGGVGRNSDADLTTLTAAVGVAVTPTTPGMSLEVYASPGIRYSKPGGGTGDSNFGFAIGANVGFGMFGAHVAYDYTKVTGGNLGIFGIGAHVALKVPTPIGM